VRDVEGVEGGGAFECEGSDAGAHQVRQVTDGAERLGEVSRQGANVGALRARHFQRERVHGEYAQVVDRDGSGVE
jgi:hypothetical protein